MKQEVKCTSIIDFRRISYTVNSLYFEGYDSYSEVAAETIISELGDESLFEDDDFNNDSFSPNK